MPDRVWMVARDAGCRSEAARLTLLDLGVAVRSNASVVDLLPLEREALVSHLMFAPIEASLGGG